MKKKTETPISRRSFLADTGKTIFYGSLISTAIPTFLSGCGKDSCNMLKEAENGSHYCDDYYICTDSRGFECPSSGDFNCGADVFSCQEELFKCGSNTFSCQPSTAYTNPKGGSGS